MAIKSLVVSIDASETGRERMGYALDLAGQHGASVLGYYASPTVGDSPEGSPEEIAAAINAEFDRQLDLRGLDGAWLLSEGPIAADIVEQIHYSDLAVIGLGSPDDIGPDPQGFSIGEIIHRSGRPILGLPISRLTPPPFKRVLVAWDASAPAARAVRDALDLLTEAAEIRIVSLGAAGPALAERLIAYFARHGIKAAFDTTPTTETDIGAELLQRAALFDAELIVAGAYGHSKLSEDLIGGTSDSLLHQMLVPVLLSH